MKKYVIYQCDTIRLVDEDWVKSIGGRFSLNLSSKQLEEILNLKLWKTYALYRTGERLWRVE